MERITEARGRQVHQQADLNALFHTVEFSGAKVLADKGDDGDAEGAGDHPVNGVNFCKGRMGRYRFRSQTVQGGLDNDVGDAVHNRLYPGRQANGDDGDQQRTMEPYFSGPQTIDVGGASKREQNQKCADGLRNDGGISGAFDAQMQQNNKKDIQPNIQKAAYHQKIQRSFGISDGTQDTGADIVNKDKNNAREIYTQIRDRSTDDIRGRLHHFQNRRRQQDAKNGCDNAAGDRKGNGGMQGVVQFPSVSGSVKSGDDYGSAGGEANKEIDHQIDDLPGGTAHRGKGVCTHKPADHNGICCIVQLLEQCPQQDRKKEKQQLFPDNTFGDLVFRRTSA